MTKPKIFSRDDHAKVIEAERKLNEALSLLDDAEACGVECQQLRELSAELIRRFGELRKRFMTPAPKR